MHSHHNQWLTDVHTHQDNTLLFTSTMMALACSKKDHTAFSQILITDAKLKVRMQLLDSVSSVVPNTKLQTTVIDQHNHLFFSWRKSTAYH